MKKVIGRIELPCYLMQLERALHHAADQGHWSDAQIELDHETHELLITVSDKPCA